MHNFDTGLQQELNMVEEYLREYLRAEGSVSQIGEILQDVAGSGGKRLRPQLLLLAAQFGPHYEEKKERLCSLASLVEMVHAASLIHDDIVDDSPLRRGRPSVQARYGKDRAVYAGDLLLSRIVKELFKGRFYEVGELFGRAVEEMCIGELGQMECLFDPEVTVERYIRNVDGKTAALCRLACGAGALESGAREADTAHLVSFGESFGRMFQIHDDIQDFVSDASAEGKPVRADFQEGILTMPVLYAMQEKEAGKRIRVLLKKASEGLFTESDSIELSGIVRESGGLEKARRDLRFYEAAAQKELEALAPCRAREILKTIASCLAK